MSLQPTEGQFKDSLHVPGAAKGVLGALDDFKHFRFPGTGIEFSGLLGGYVVILAAVDDQDGSGQVAHSLAKIVSGGVLKIGGL